MEIPGLRCWARTTRVIHSVPVQTWKFALLSGKGTKHCRFLRRGTLGDGHPHEEANWTHPRTEELCQQEKPWGSSQKIGEGFGRTDTDQEPRNIQRITAQWAQEGTQGVLITHQLDCHEVDRIAVKRWDFHLESRSLRDSQDGAQGWERRGRWGWDRSSDRRYLESDPHRIWIITE